MGGNSLPFFFEVTMQLPNDIALTVQRALAEDIGTGDVTADLIPADKQSVATVITREPAVIAGVAWVNEVFQQLESPTYSETLYYYGVCATVTLHLQV